MCGPVAGLLQAGIGAMSSIAEYNAEVEDFDAKEEQWKKNYTLSLEEARSEENQLTTKAVEEQAATAQKVQVYTQEGQIKAATAEASAAGAGIAGNSVDEIIRNVVGGAAKNRAAAEENANFTAAEIALEQKATVTDAEAHIASVVRPRPPNPAKAILGVAGALIGGIGGLMG